MYLSVQMLDSHFPPSVNEVLNVFWCSVNPHTFCAVYAWMGAIISSLTGPPVHVTNKPILYMLYLAYEIIAYCDKYKEDIIISSVNP